MDEKKLAVAEGVKALLAEYADHELQVEQQLALGRQQQRRAGLTARQGFDIVAEQVLQKGAPVGAAHANQRAAGLMVQDG